MATSMGPASLGTSAIPKFKVGDIVVCDVEINLPSTIHGGGGGYSPGKNFVVREVTYDGSYFIYWPTGGGNGVYEYALQGAGIVEQKEETEFIDLSAL